jgi:hypothetical protein
MSPARYQAFLEATMTEVAPLTRMDAERAAAVTRYGASIWTRDGDFLKFLPKASVRLIPHEPKKDGTRQPPG